MTKQLFVPYKGKAPATVMINGHRLVILSADKDDLEENLTLVGGTRLRKLRTGSSPEEEQARLHRLAEEVQGGIVIAPHELPVPQVLKSLEEQLPWIN
jgi:hypothetical protein